MKGSKVWTTYLVLSLLILRPIYAVDFIEDPVRMPGWKGELPSTLQEVHDSRAFGELGEVRSSAYTWRRMCLMICFSFDRVENLGPEY